LKEKLKNTSQKCRFGTLPSIVYQHRAFAESANTKHTLNLLTNISRCDLWFSAHQTWIESGQPIIERQNTKPVSEIKPIF